MSKTETSASACSTSSVNPVSLMGGSFPQPPFKQAAGSGDHERQRIVAVVEEGAVSDIVRSPIRAACKRLRSVSNSAFCRSRE